LAAILVSRPDPPPELLDAALLAAAAAGDEPAQRMLVERLMGRVRRVARLLCRDTDDADDAAQLALLEILRSAHTLRSLSGIERWSDRIVVRVALRFARRDGRRNRLLKRWLLPDLTPWGQSTRVEQADRVHVDRLLGRLTEVQREAFVLHHALEYTVEEIADVTGTRVGTVKDRLVTARKVLRRMLEREFDATEAGS
jgi:RNA polymerase sigma-70 factor (ECF subfamily)